MPSHGTEAMMAGEQAQLAAIHTCPLLRGIHRDEWLCLLRGSMLAQPRMLLLVRTIELDRYGQL